MISPTKPYSPFNQLKRRSRDLPNICVSNPDLSNHGTEASSLFDESPINRTSQPRSSSILRRRPIRGPVMGPQTRINLGRVVALPVNMAVYFALGTCSKSVGNAKKARESRVPVVAVPAGFVGGVLTGGIQGAGTAVTDTVQIIRGKKSRRQTLMVV